MQYYSVPNSPPIPLLAASHVHDNLSPGIPPSPYYPYCPPPTYHNYMLEPEFVSASPADCIAYQPDVPLHAPVPLSGYSTLISPTSPHTSALPTPAHSATSPPQSQPIHTPAEPQSPLDVYGNAPQVMFPTPCELLTDLAAREQCAAAGAAAAANAQPPASKSSGAGRKAKSPKTQPETQRKAYFRAVAESIGFQPTDPDTITSHNKKRSYLECLERYVQWLHEQIQLAGHEPIPLERVSTYPGLNSRSIRTLLVHMQTDISKLHALTMEDERTYMYLENQLAMRQMAVEEQAREYRQTYRPSYPYGHAEGALGRNPPRSRM